MPRRVTASGSRVQGHREHQVVVDEAPGAGRGAVSDDLDLLMADIDAVLAENEEELVDMVQNYVQRGGQ